MIELVEDVGGVVTEFVGRLIPGGERGFDKASAIGYVLDGKIVGGTVFHNYDPEAGVVELTTAATSPHWLTRHTLRAIFAIPFDRWGCQMVVLRVAEDNFRMRHIARRFGFNEYVIPRLAGRDKATVIYTLTDDQWRTSPLEKRHARGQALRTEDAIRH